MISIKIFGAMVGAALVLYGFYIALAAPRKRDLLGPIVAVGGFMIFCLSLLLWFVPGFFG